MINFDHSSGKSRKLSVILYALIGFVQLVYLSTVSYYESFFSEMQFYIAVKIIVQFGAKSILSFCRSIRRLALAY